MTYTTRCVIDDVVYTEQRTGVTEDDHLCPKCREAIEEVEKDWYYGNVEGSEFLLEYRELEDIPENVVETLRTSKSI